MSNVETQATRGRKAILSSRDLIMRALVAVRDNTENMPSAPIIAQLVASGHLVKEQAEPTGRGRPRVNVLVAPKYRGQVALWEQTQAKRDAKAEAQAIVDADARIERRTARVDELREQLAAAEARLAEAIIARKEMEPEPQLMIAEE